MVRRGSTVRVRQRALQNPCKAAPFPLCGTCTWSRMLSYGALYGAPTLKNDFAFAPKPLAFTSEAAPLAASTGCRTRRPNDETLSRSPITRTRSGSEAFLGQALG